MPSLNITFSDEEYSALRKAALRAEVSLKTFVHDAVVEAVSGRKRRLAELAEGVAEKSGELNQRLV